MTQPAVAPSISLVAGSLQQAGSQDGVGVAAQFAAPEGVAQDSAGNIYVADRLNHTIRKLSPDGNVSTVAGAPGQEGSADGTGAAARFSLPRAVAVDAAGNLYVADQGNHTIRKISPAGAVSTLAGAAGQSGAVDGPGITARFQSPVGLALDLEGNLLVADVGGAIRKVAPDGTVSVFAGKLGDRRFVVGNGDQARFDTVLGVAVDGAGNVYVADLEPRVFSGVGRVRKLDRQARAVPWGGFADGVIPVNAPVAIAASAAGNVVVASSDRGNSSFPQINSALNRILLITPLGIVTPLAGQDGKSGTADGPGGAATFGFPKGLAVGRGGQVIVADTDNHAIRQIDAQGVVSTLAGGSGRGYIDAQGTSARFSGVSGIAAAADGTLYLADSLNRAVRKVSPAGLVSTVPITNADGSPSSSTEGAEGIALAPGGALYVESARGRLVRAVDLIEASGRRRMLVDSTFGGPIAADSTGRLILSYSGTVARVDMAGNSQELATGFKSITAVAAAASNLIYVAVSDHTVSAIDAQGGVSLVAGQPGLAGHADGAGVLAQFDMPRALALDAQGNLYVADVATVRRITPQGVVTTIAALAGQPALAAAAVAVLPGNVRGLAWANGALYGVVGNAVIRISPVP